MSCNNCNNGLCRDCNQGNNCNPCSACPENTADCETLPSALDNFTRQFFGTVERVVIDGQITWVLPGNLNAGLPGNPRLDGEGLATYFMRLLNGEIVGLTGPKGDTGTPGLNGRNAYTITTSQFLAPTQVNPNSQFTIIASPVVSIGQTIFVPTIGWLLVTDIFQGTEVFTTLVELIPGSAAVAVPGLLVLPSGPRGLSIVGPQGPQGDKGDKGDQGVPGDTGNTGATGATGPAGAAATNTNGTVTGGTTNYTLTNAYAKVDFGTNDLEKLFTEAGTYLIIVHLPFVNDSGNAHQYSFKLFNATTAADVDNSEIEFLKETHTGRQSKFVQSLVTVGAGETIQVYGKSSSNDAGQRIEYTGAWLSYVKLQ